MQTIGLCRFSYPAIGGFQVEHNNIEDRIAYLYTPDRMEERFALFEAITLPALKAQTDPDFDLVVLIGDSLPNRYETRLRDLCSDVKQVHIRTEAPARHRALMRKILNEARRDLSEPCLQFRMDDDDGVAVDFIQHLKTAVKDCAGLVRRNDHVAFDFNAGFLVKAEAGQLLVSEVVRPYQTAALAISVGGGVTKSIMNFAHHRIFQHMPTVTLNQRAMFLRSHNQFNDSRQKNVAREDLHPITDPERRVLQHSFAIGSSEINQLCDLSRLRS